MSGRLDLAAKAYEKYGLSLFGRHLEQIGGGGSTFSNPNYNFVDITYILILLRYGIILTVAITALWILMTRKATFIGDRRLAIALAIIAFHSVSEHHFPEINYNILIAVPFALLTTTQTQSSPIQGEGSAKKQPGIHRLAALNVWLAIIILSIICIQFMLPTLRTVFDVTGATEDMAGRRRLFICGLLGAALLLVAIQELNRIIKALIAGKRPGRLSLIAPAALIVVTSIALMASNMIINRHIPEIIETIQSEETVINLIKENKKGELVSDFAPKVYGDLYGGFRSHIFDGDELARYEDITVITNIRMSGSKPRE